MKQESPIWILMSRSLNGEATREEKEELSFLLNNDDKIRQEYDLLSQIWQQNSSNIYTDQTDNELFLTSDRIIRKAKKLEQKEVPVVGESFFYKHRNWLAAASIIAVMMVIFQFANKSIVARPTVSSPHYEQEVMETALGQKSKSTLPDGTIVWLNAGSKLQIENDFGKTLREVSLIGEGYFEVAKNKAVPFIIHTRTIDIKVTGTSFNVKAYPKDLNTETSLIQGSIEVTIKNVKTEKVFLQANDKLIVANLINNVVAPIITQKKRIAHSFILEKINVDSILISSSEIKWIENKLIFDNEELSEILRQMERWYNVKINIGSTVKMNKKFTVDFSKENISEALEALKAVRAFDYTIQNKLINIF